MASNVLMKVTDAQGLQPNIFEAIWYKRGVQQMTSGINRKLNGYSKLQIMIATAVGVLFLDRLVKKMDLRSDEPLRERMGRWAMTIPLIQKEYEKDIQKQLDHFCLKVQEKWKVFGDPILEIPKDG